MSDNINSQALKEKCDEYLDMLEAGTLPLSEQSQAGVHLRDRIRRLANTCDAGLAGRLITGKWQHDGDEFDSYQAYVETKASDR